jgi:hypothetical protein
MKRIPIQRRWARFPLVGQEEGASARDESKGRKVAPPLIATERAATRRPPAPTASDPDKKMRARGRPHPSSVASASCQVACQGNKSSTARSDQCKNDRETVTVRIITSSVMHRTDRERLERSY